MRIRSIKPEFWRSGLIHPDDVQSFKAFGNTGCGQRLLYLLHDAHYRLLYVGITWKPFDRWREHKTSKPWWKEVAHVDTWLCADERSAREAERWCIKNLDPVHNKHQNSKWHSREAGR